jgi:hypothetical protein
VSINLAHILRFGHIFMKIRDLDLLKHFINVKFS